MIEPPALSCPLAFIEAFHFRYGERGRRYVKGSSM
jgi:hypothetical protein